MVVLAVEVLLVENELAAVVGKLEAMAAARMLADGFRTGFCRWSYFCKCELKCRAQLRP